MTNITLEELYQAWQGLLPAETQTEGFTVGELQEALGVCKDVARRNLRAAVESGRAYFAGTRSGKRMDGISYRVPVYKFREEKKP